MSESNVLSVRQGIIQALPAETSSHGRIPEQKEVYVPPSHIKALRMECNLVIGARGVGKTFWSAALRSEAIRKLLGESVPDLTKVDVKSGFGESPDLDAYPDQDVFGSLVSRNIEPYHIWQAVLARWLAGCLGREVPRENWVSTADWVRSDPESFGRLLEHANTKFEQDGRQAIVVFDALDRTSVNWQTMDKIVRDLLRVVLLLKRFPRLHSKVFLREDQFHGRQISDFPDASKLLATRVELTWASHDLHGLLWQYLCNANEPHGLNLRNLYEGVVGTTLANPAALVWSINDIAKREGNIQRALFENIAGKWMGRDRRRGVPYTWSVGHLADGKGRTSPRSFLAAIRAAAENTQARYPDWSTPLHYECIKQGVQKASEIRVSELAEDYPWVKTYMNTLRGLTVPCNFEDIQGRWVTEFDEKPASIPAGSLPPEHFELGWEGVRADLEKLGIFESRRDGRVNMPDLYRVGFGLGRRGGVRPVARTSQG